uniref:Uncharacterized protein n=1 Tax=Octopus bimaculoides TaxID=37653 RepID=A0A0L8I954_OCTBM
MLENLKISTNQLIGPFTKQELSGPVSHLNIGAYHLVLKSYQIIDNGTYFCYLFSLYFNKYTQTKQQLIPFLFFTVLSFNFINILTGKRLYLKLSANKTNICELIKLLDE